ACRDQQRQLLGRGQQNIGRQQLLALTLVPGGVAGAGLDGNGQADLLHRLAEIALDIDGKRLQWRDIERVDAAMRLARLSPWPVRKFSQRGQEPGQRLAGAGRSDQQDRLSGLGLRQKFNLMGARRPAFLAKPSDKWFGQGYGSILVCKARLLCHPPEVARRQSIAKKNRNKRGSFFPTAAETPSGRHRDSRCGRRHPSVPRATPAWCGRWRGSW